MNYNMGLYRELRSNKFKSFEEGMNSTQWPKKALIKIFHVTRTPTLAIVTWPILKGIV